MKILSIETSCDETAITILECTGDLPNPKFNILGNSLLSQIDIHAQYGGVYPMLAKREHEKNLPVLLEETLRKSDLNVGDMDYIAVTAGPGLEPALWAGITFAEELGKKFNKQVLPVNHMEGHLFSFLFDQESEASFPAVALLVSGGHTELVEINSFDNFKIIGKTRDDAVGEAFDKVARILGLPYPGGPKLSNLAEADRAKNPESKLTFPRPMINSSDLDFSYSGLKTAVLYAVNKMSELTEENKQEIARAFEDAAIDPLIEKTVRAVEKVGAKSLILGGGVSANKYLQSRVSQLAEEYSLNLYLPDRELTTDNAVMIGIAAYIRLKTNRVQPEQQIEAEGNLALS